jgi:hypothetical protein
MSTRAISKSSEKVQAASLRKEEEDGRLQLQPTMPQPRSQLRRRLGYAKNYVIAPVAGKKIRSRARSLLIVQDHLRRRFARFKLGAHPLDLGCLLFYRRHEGGHPGLIANLKIMLRPTAGRGANRR